MLRTFLSGLMIFLFIMTFGQTASFTTRGKVLDAVTKQPLSGASVFCQNTTFGTITNNEGEFFLKLPNGGYDLIVSYTSYETQSQHINNINTTNITVELQMIDKSLSEVTIVGSNEVADGLLKYGKFFTEHFVGTTPNAAQCTIQNPDLLQFYFNKKKIV